MFLTKSITLLHSHKHNLISYSDTAIWIINVIDLIYLITRIHESC